MASEMASPALTGALATLARKSPSKCRRSKSSPQSRAQRVKKSQKEPLFRPQKAVWAAVEQRQTGVDLLLQPARGVVRVLPQDGGHVEKPLLIALEAPVLENWSLHLVKKKTQKTQRSQKQSKTSQCLASKAMSCTRERKLSRSSPHSARHC